LRIKFALLFGPPCAWLLDVFFRNKLQKLCVIVLQTSSMESGRAGPCVVAIDTVTPDHVISHCSLRRISDKSVDQEEPS